MTLELAPESFSLSDHAIERMAQRGIRVEALHLLLAYGTEFQTVGACEKYQLRLQDGHELRKSGRDPKLVDSARKLIAVVNGSGVVVTCYHANAGQKSSLPHDRSPVAKRRSRRFGADDCEIC